MKRYGTTNIKINGKENGEKKDDDARDKLRAFRSFLFFIIIFFFLFFFFI